MDRILITVILAATVAMFVRGPWRHDMVALGSLLACVAAGLVAPAEAFAGFGHPAVVTVACVLVLSRALLVTGAIDGVVRRVLPARAGATASLLSLTGLAAVLSAFMNNVGALALLMPVGLQLAARLDLPPGRVLMPLAFGSILGGMTTLIGTPPNLIVSGFRAEAGGEGFGMFDFTPVGLAVAGLGVLFVALGGWRLVPARERAGAESFDTGTYLTEARVGVESASAGRTLRDIGPAMAKADAQVVALVRGEERRSAPRAYERLKPGDILVIEAEPGSLASVLSTLDLDLEESVPLPPGNKPGDKKKGPDEVVLMELVARPDAALTGRSATDLQLRSRHGINLLALSRRGRRSIRRLRSEAIQAGDVMLMQGPEEAVRAFAAEHGCVPLAERSLRIPEPRKAVAALAVMAAAVGGAAFGLLPAAVAFAAGALACMALKLLPWRSVYQAVDWPVVVLLGALIPVAGAMESTGAADAIAAFLMDAVARGSGPLALALILVVTMFLSDVMNNAATAAVMCPVALSAAQQLEARPDSFLMAVAIGASCAFLTPIGHQNNTLILGPGGFRFGDYWRLGLPLEALVVGVGVPMLLWIWPL